ncbi:hypothetical protein EST38_g12485 [Candolleomyces aberdarensis]|uniref:Uncharacterized protein n=1 Tax=Candolleomyces aberdarensis TaxID=2316362 RepID=A0A4V1Q201_9AGAR|nr:hypothetical protein EST38_g12485 [Candolleomyces aberdarensis]
MISNDALAKQMAFEAIRHAQCNRLSTVKCALIASQCSKIHIVQVPVDRGYDLSPRAIDLDCSLFLHTWNAPEHLVMDLDEVMVDVGAYPNNPLAHTYRWTVVSSIHHMPKVNELIRTFEGADCLTRDVYGSFLVVKRDRNDILCNVGVHDLGLIKSMLINASSGTWLPSVTAVSPEEIACVSPSLGVVATLSRALNTVRQFEEASLFYAIPEMRAILLRYCDHFTVMALSRVNQEGRRSAQVEIRARLKMVVAPFVPSERFASFMNLLQITGTIIIGSVARRLFTINSAFIQDIDEPEVKRYTTSANLNLCTPPGKRDLVVRWLTNEKFLTWSPSGDRRQAARGLEVVASSFMTGCRDVKGSKHFVTVTESRGSVLAVVLSSTYTAQTNAISATRLYCFYPNLITSEFSLRSDIAKHHLHRRSSIGFKLQSSNRSWQAPCGPVCPATTRKTIGDKGVASFVWDPSVHVPQSRHEETDYLLAQVSLRFRFSKVCRNMFCRNYEPDLRGRRAM